MLAYSSFLALEHQKNVYSTVLYFRPSAGRRDTGIYRYGNAQRGGVRFQYNVIHIYDLPGEALLDPEAVGLLPFTALMKPPPNTPPHAWIEKCIETTQMADVDSGDAGNAFICALGFREFGPSGRVFSEPHIGGNHARNLPLLNASYNAALSKERAK